MKTNIKTPAMAWLFIGLVASCGTKKAAEVVQSTPTVVKKTNCNASNSYTNNIKGLVDMHCAKSCHSANRHADGIDLSTYDLLKEEAMKPRFMAAIKHQMLATPMPLKAAKLSDSTIQVIECWIENGMVN
jgi:uncharacterized membrane protein